MRPFQPIIGRATQMFTCGSTRTLTRQYGLSTWLASVGVVAPVLPVLTSSTVTAASAMSLIAPIPAIVQEATAAIDRLSGTYGNRAPSLGVSAAPSLGTSGALSLGVSAPPSFAPPVPPPKMPLLLLHPSIAKAVIVPSAAAEEEDIRPGVIMRLPPCVREGVAQSRVIERS